MPMFKLSRYRYSTQFTEDGISYIDEREPFRYREDSGNRFHRVKSGDTWWGLAHLYFSGFERPAGLWWLICEYQPVSAIYQRKDFKYDSLSKLSYNLAAFVDYFDKR
jgi:hypothetical protein